MEEYDYTADHDHLLQLLTHHVFDTQQTDFFLRELICNSFDACQRLRYHELQHKQPTTPFTVSRIDIEVCKEHFQLIIRDNGIGMTYEEMKTSLGTIAKHRPKIATEIGKFGIGFYSSFIVATHVRVVSRSIHAMSQPTEWISESEKSSYQLRTIEEQDPELPERHGTTILLQLKTTCLKYLDTYYLQSLVKKYCQYTTIPIYINQLQCLHDIPLWTRPPSELTPLDYMKCYQYLTQQSSSVAQTYHCYRHFTLEHNSSQWRCLLYLPMWNVLSEVNTSTSSIQIYAQNVLVQKSATHIIPSYLHFIAGVLDMDDSSSLTIFRNHVKPQQHHHLQKQLLKKIFQMIQSLPEPEYLQSFYYSFCPYLKRGICEDAQHRSLLFDFLRYPTSIHSMISLQDYVNKNMSTSKHIYYLYGDTTLYDLQKSALLQYYPPNSVLLMTDRDDLCIFEICKTYQDYTFIDISIPTPTTVSLTTVPVEYRELLQWFRTVLYGKVDEIFYSQRLNNTNMPPCLFTTTSMIGNIRYLELNRYSPIMEQLITLINKQQNITELIMYLYEMSLLVGGFSVSSYSMFQMRGVHLLQLAMTQWNCPMTQTLEEINPIQEADFPEEELYELLNQAYEESLMEKKNVSL